MAKYCTQCGHQIDDDAKFCANCGAAVVLTSAAPVSNNFGSLTFQWSGAWMAVDTNIRLSLNGKLVGDGLSFMHGFSVTAPIPEKVGKIHVNAGPMLQNNILCTFEEGTNYTCTFAYSRFVGAFTYKIVDQSGKVIHRQGYSVGRKILLIASIVVIALSLLYFVFAIISIL